MPVEVTDATRRLFDAWMADWIKRDLEDNPRPVAFPHCHPDPAGELRRLELFAAHALGAVVLMNRDHEQTLRTGTPPTLLGVQWPDRYAMVAMEAARGLLALFREVGNAQSEYAKRFESGHSARSDGAA